MSLTFSLRFILCALLLSFVSEASRAALVSWTVDTTQSFLQLSMPNQAVSVNGTPSGNAFFRNQGATSGTWTLGNQSSISGTLSTDFQDGSLIKFRTGEHSLSALNSGSFAPDFAGWNVGTSTFSPPNATAPAAFGGQIGSTQTGNLPIVFNDAMRFAIRNIAYDLSSANLAVAANQFSANLTSFGMSAGNAGVRGNATAMIPSDFGTLADTGITVSGANTAALGTITAPNMMQPNLRKLTLPISIPVTMQLANGTISTLSGTAMGQIVAFAMVPEPSTLVLCNSFAVCGLCWVIRHARRGAC